MKALLDFHYTSKVPNGHARNHIYYLALKMYKFFSHNHLSDQPFWFNCCDMLAMANLHDTTTQTPTLFIGKHPSDLTRTEEYFSEIKFGI